MSGSAGSLEQHLRNWAAAYGPDLAIPPGQLAPRPAPGSPTAEPRSAEHGVRATPSSSPSERTASPSAESQSTEAPSTDSLPRSSGASVRRKEQIPVESDRDRAAAGQPEAGARSEAPPAGDATLPADGAPDQDNAAAALRELREEVLPCTRCKLHTGRRSTVFGEGNARARVLFVGEAPGAKEDQSGRPFVGPAGQLLDRILEGAMGLRRSDVFIANVNKCRPPNNRAPEADEVAACLPFLKRQVEIVQPEVIVCLGRTAAQNLLGTTESTTAMRQRQHEYAGTPVVVTWHPAYLLREPGRKRETWEDIKKVNALLGLPEVPGSAR